MVAAALDRAVGAAVVELDEALVGQERCPRGRDCEIYAVVLRLEKLRGERTGF